MFRKLFIVTTVSLFTLSCFSAEDSGADKPYVGKKKLIKVKKPYKQLKKDLKLIKTPKPDCMISIGKISLRLTISQ